MDLYKNRLAALRHEISRKEGDGFIIPHTDIYHGEYISAADERLAWLTGFTGSAGVAVVLAHKAAIFVDGRYTLQAGNQVDRTLYEVCPLTSSAPFLWVMNNLHEGQKLYYDSWLHTLDEVRQGDKFCQTSNISLVTASENFIDVLWNDRPLNPCEPVKVHDLSGMSSQAKRVDFINILQKKKVDGFLVTASDSLSWLLNIRGNDVPHTPVARGFAMAWADGTVDLFINLSQLDNTVKEHLGDDVRLHAPQSLESWLRSLKERTILIDPSQTPMVMAHCLDNCLLMEEADLCLLPKAIKNPVEIKGAVDAHIEDGIALARFFAWLSQALSSPPVTESEAAEKLLFFRRQSDLFRDMSFPTISAAGAHGAIIHYQSTPQTNQPLQNPSLYLVDSGGQYLCGTTDVTRTLAIGKPTEEQKDRFTRVLKGHIAVAMAVFPKGTTGSHLDSFARQYLWQAGLDYNHGTGHGVGSYLAVHEGPHRIGKASSTIALCPGMIVSNEPGYYKTGEYGIRIESLIRVVEKGMVEGGELPLLGFETLTLSPIDLSLVNLEMLTSIERFWLNSYHTGVYKILGSRLDATEKKWLKQATQAL